MDAFHAYAHLRVNEYGPTKEYWYHANGCRRWLVVSCATRGTIPSWAWNSPSDEQAGTMRLNKGGLIDRNRPLRFTFDGRDYNGFAGDTLASALVANDVRLLGRSFKYHRPRGLFTAGPDEPNALIELRRGARREPNTKATTVELFDGLEAESQNRFPSLKFDLLSVNNLL